MTGATRSPLTRIVIAQVIVTVLSSAALWVFDWVAAYSALLGGLTCVIPGLYTLATSLQGGDAGNGFARVIKGEGGRLAITIAMFLAVFIFVKPLNVLAFFGLFAVLQFFYAVVPVLDARRLRRPPG